MFTTDQRSVIAVVFIIQVVMKHKLKHNLDNRQMMLMDRDQDGVCKMPLGFS